MTTNHRLTWRGRCAVVIEATSREEAIKRAILDRGPDHFPPGTELYYGLAGTRGAVYTVPHKDDALQASEFSYETKPARSRWKTLAELTVDKPAPTCIPSPTRT